jgi:hypothetical protein
MILPGKHIDAENAIIGIGADVLASLTYPRTVSVLFDLVQKRREIERLPRIHFDWFLLSLDFLFAIGAIRLERDLIRKQNS